MTTTPTPEIDLPPAVTDTVLTTTDVAIELGLSVAFLVFIIALHGWLLTIASKQFSRRFSAMTPQTPRWQVNVLMSGTVAALVFIHIVEMLIWAAPFAAIGVIPDYRHAFIFVMEAYTTLGESVVTLPERYRGLGPIVAISGLFTFGWTGSALVYVMSQILRLEALRARHDARSGTRSLADVSGPFGT